MSELQIPTKPRVVAQMDVATGDIELAICPAASPTTLHSRDAGNLQQTWALGNLPLVHWHLCIYSLAFLSI